MQTFMFRGEGVDVERISLRIRRRKKAGVRCRVVRFTSARNSSDKMEMPGFFNPAA